MSKPTRRQQLASAAMGGGAVTQAKLAAMFGLKSQSAISKRLKRFRAATLDRYATALSEPGRPKKLLRPIQLSMLGDL